MADVTDHGENRALPDCSTHGAFGRGIEHLSYHLGRNEMPADWPGDVCRDANCGMWERNNGQYFWHLADDHRGPE